MSTPGDVDRSRDTHHRVRTDKIDKSGTVTLRVDSRLRHIGVGRTHAGTHVMLIVQDHHIRIVNPPPAKSSANSPSTPAATTNPAAPPEPPK